MRDGLLWLMDSVIDYAGLFPPAKLDMKPAIKEYLEFAGGDDQWIVDRYICPAARLEELAKEIEEQQPEIPFGISVIGTGGGDFAAAVANDKKLIEAFSGRVEAAFLVDAYEVRSTGNVSSDAAALSQLKNLEVHLEIPLDDLMSDRLHEIAETEWLRAKARTGGLTKESFPPADRLAGFLQECSNLELSYKLTAGLHHPLVHVDEATGGIMHGFLNVLIAAALIESNDLNRIEITEVLDDPDPRHFAVLEDRVGWRDLFAEYNHVADMRELFIGFGSCSIAEPLAGLRELGILGEHA